MEANLRIVKSIQKINDNILENKKEQDAIANNQDKLKEEQNKLEKQLNNVFEEQEDIKKEQRDFQEQIENKINDIKIKTPKDGKDGKNGADGKDGRNGIDGKDGVNGKDGKNGLNGKDGKDGRDGIDGNDGVGIKDANINEEGELIITLTNNKKINCGVARGKNGIGWAGTSVTNAQIIDGHLIITLSTGKEIDAGYIGGTGGEEVDPIFTASPAYNITNQDISNWNNKSDFSGDYEDLTNKPDIPVIPTNISAFNNDAGYLTQHQDISGKYDKTGGEISGNVKVDGTFTLDIEDEDYDAGIRFDKALDNNLGTTMTLTGYAGDTNYKPIIRNIGTPNSSYDVANKKYVDDNVVIPTYHLVFLNPDGTIDTYASTINYNTIKNNLTDPKEKDYLDIVWNTTRFYAEVVEITDVNTGDIKFIADIEYAGIPRRMVFTLNPQSVLTTTSITTGEIVSNKSQSILTDTGSTDKYTSVKSVEDFVKPVVVWESNDPTQYLKGIQANISASPAWQLTNLNMTPFKRIKIYSCAGQATGATASSSTTPAMVLEMSLDERASISAYGGNFVGSVISQKPNNDNRLATLTCAVSADKTKFVVLRQTNLYGTASTNNNDVNANVFKIEGYYY